MAIAPAATELSLVGNWGSLPRSATHHKHVIMWYGNNTGANVDIYLSRDGESANASLLQSYSDATGAKTIELAAPAGGAIMVNHTGNATFYQYSYDDRSRSMLGGGG